MHSKSSFLKSLFSTFAFSYVAFLPIALSCMTLFVLLSCENGVPTQNMPDSPFDWQDSLPEVPRGSTQVLEATFCFIGGTLQDNERNPLPGHLVILESPELFSGTINGTPLGSDQLQTFVRDTLEQRKDSIITDSSGSFLFSHTSCWNPGSPGARPDSLFFLETRHPGWERLRLQILPELLFQAKYHASYLYPTITVRKNTPNTQIDGGLLYIPPDSLRNALSYLQKELPQTWPLEGNSGHSARHLLDSVAQNLRSIPFGSAELPEILLYQGTNIYREGPLFYPETNRDKAKADPNLYWYDTLTGAFSIDSGLAGGTYSVALTLPGEPGRWLISPEDSLFFSNGGRADSAVSDSLSAEKPLNLPELADSLIKTYEYTLFDSLEIWPLFPSQSEALPGELYQGSSSETENQSPPATRIRLNSFSARPEFHTRQHWLLFPKVGS